jgi:hypothetical protein
MAPDSIYLTTSRRELPRRMLTAARPRRRFRQAPQAAFSPRRARLSQHEMTSFTSSIESVDLIKSIDGHDVGHPVILTRYRDLSERQEGDMALHLDTGVPSVDAADDSPGPGGGMSWTGWAAGCATRQLRAARCGSAR